MYKLTGNPKIVRKLNDDGTFTEIPEGHPLFDEFNAWVAEGNTPAPADQAEQP